MVDLKATPPGLETDLPSSEGGLGTRPDPFSLLRCPAHPNQGELRVVNGAREHTEKNPRVSLECRQCGESFPMIDGIVDFVTQIKSDSNGAYTQKESQQWDAQAAEYDLRRQADAIYDACCTAAVQSISPVEPGQAVLEVGCGTGMVTERYFHDALTLVAVDISLESLRTFRQKIDHPNVVCVRADARRLPLENASFDRVLCPNTLQHLPSHEDRAAVVRELLRVTKSQGIAGITAHNYSKLKRLKGWKKEGKAGSAAGEYIYRFEREEFRSLLAEHFHVGKVWGVGLPLPYRWKLSPASRLFERALSRLGPSSAWGHMLAAQCQPLAPTENRHPASDSLPAPAS